MHPIALLFFGFLLVLFFVAQHLVSAFLDIETAHHQRVEQFSAQHRIPSEPTR